MRYLFLATLFFSCIETPLQANPKDSLRFFQPSPVLNKPRAIGLAATETILLGGSLIGLNQLWYVDYPRQRFHFFNDNAEWLQMDKLGHVYSSYALGSLGILTTRWAGISRNKSRWIGGLVGMVYLSGIEVLDGFSAGWGFSVGDMAANALGAGFLIGQDIVWQEQRLAFKYGFRKSDFPKYRPDLLGSNRVEQWFKDYNAQTYWLSINIASFLGAETRFPSWLNLAVGYGAEGMIGGRTNPILCNAQGTCIGFERYRQYYLSIDIDMRKFNVKQQWLKTILAILGRIKIPAPGLVYGNGRFGFVFQ